MALDAYNAQYPLAFYEVGTAYSFYQHKTQGTNVKEATEEQISKFEGALTNAKAQNVFTPESGDWLAFKRTIGVVIDKYKTGHANIPAALEVMFENAGEYTVRKYGIEMASAFFDDKEFVPVHERKGGKTGPTTAGTTGPTTAGTVTGPTVSKVTGPTKE